MQAFTPLVCHRRWKAHDFEVCPEDPQRASETRWILQISLAVRFESEARGATTLAASGVPDRVIRAMGRWKSGAYRLYIDLQLHEKEMWAEVVNRLLRSKEEGDQVSIERLSEIIDG